MCLIVESSIPKIADKDIICYKLVKRTKVKGVYESQYQRFEYIIRQLYTNIIDIKFIRNLILYRTLLGYSIERDMFHSYVSNLNPIILSCLPDYTLVKCVIPKGAYYFKGVYNDVLSYASSQIKILEEI